MIIVIKKIDVPLAEGVLTKLGRFSLGNIPVAFNEKRWEVAIEKGDIQPIEIVLVDAINEKEYSVSNTLADELLKKHNSGIREVELDKDFRLQGYQYVSGGLRPVGEVGGKGLIHHEGEAAVSLAE